MADKSPTSTWLESSHNPVQPGQGFSLSAHVNRVGHHHVHGDVEFACDGEQIGGTAHRTDSTGVAAIGIPGGSIPAGEHTFTAKFLGDGYNDASESESLVVNLIPAEGEERPEAQEVAAEPVPSAPEPESDEAPHVMPLPPEPIDESARA